MSLLTTPMMFVATVDPERARAFYQDVLEFSFVTEAPHALVFHINRTITLMIQKVVQFTPAEHTVLGWAVDDINEVVAHLNDNGVAFKRYPHLSQDDNGIWEAPGGARIAWFQDPDGNVLSLTQR